MKWTQFDSLHYREFPNTPKSEGINIQLIKSNSPGNDLAGATISAQITCSSLTEDASTSAAEAAISKKKKFCSLFFFCSKSKTSLWISVSVKICSGVE